MSDGYINLPVQTGTGIMTLNGNASAAQTIAGGTGISVSSVGGTTTISFTGSSGGIQSINADTTAAQVIAGGTDISVSTVSGTTTISFTGTFADQALDNLGTTAINADLLPGTTNTINLGNGSDLFLSGYLNQEFLGSYTSTSYAYYFGQGLTPYLPALFISNNATDQQFSSTFSSLTAEVWGLTNSAFAGSSITLGSAGGTPGTGSYLSSGTVAHGVFFCEYNGETTFDQNSAQITIVAMTDHSSSDFGTAIILQSTDPGTTSLINTLQLYGSNMSSPSIFTTTNSTDANGTTDGAICASNGGIFAALNIVGGAGGFGGVIPSNDVTFAVRGHWATSQVTAPTSTPQTGAGTGATANNSLTATDTAGWVSLTTGSIGWASGAQVTLNFTTPYTSISPTVQLTPANAATALAATTVQPYVTSTSNDFTVSFRVADTSAHTYQWNYTVISD